jgi:hypothetical protein
MYNKIGAEFKLETPMKMTIQNIVFDMIDGWIPTEDDPDNCKTERKM